MLRDVKCRPRAEAPRLALISIAITPQTRTHKNKWCISRRRHTSKHAPQTQETVLTAHTTTFLPFSIPSTKKKKKQMGVLHSMLPRREYPLLPLFSLISSALLSLFSPSHSLILLRVCAWLQGCTHSCACLCVRGCFWAALSLSSEDVICCRGL